MSYLVPIYQTAGKVKIRIQPFAVFLNIKVENTFICTYLNLPLVKIRLTLVLVGLAREFLSSDIECQERTTPFRKQKETSRDKKNDCQVQN